MPLLISRRSVIAAPLLAALPNQLTEAERRAGWRLLFDGRTTDGWLEVTGKPFPTNCWSIKDGCLKALVRQDGFQDIRTVDSFRAFDLTFEWKLLAQGNSGLKYLIQRVDEWTNKEGRQARARGLEFQLADNANPDAASDPRRSAGSLYSVIAPDPPVKPAVNQFNTARLLVQKNGRVEHYLNGTRVVAFQLTDPAVDAALRTLQKEGPRITASPLSLQNHASETWFRNLKLRPLD